MKWMIYWMDLGLGSDTSYSFLKWKVEKAKRKLSLIYYYKLGATALY